MMIPFDIFKVMAEGDVRWIEAAATCEEAKARVYDLANQSPGQYMIFDQQTGDQLFICPRNEKGEAAHGHASAAANAA